MLQYIELGYLCYKLRYIYAIILYSISAGAVLSGNYELYKKRLELYTAVSQRHLIPIVQGGIVR